MIKIVEVGPRDGLQNESRHLSYRDKLKFIVKLYGTGLRAIEAGAFVSPKWVPQMADTDKVFSLLRKCQNLKNQKQFSALVPNIKGLERAIESGVKVVSIFGACSESFSQKNINCSINESFLRFAEVIDLALKHKIKVRGYLSTAFGCPYEGKISAKKVESLIKRMLNMGVYEVSVGDTIGVATPLQVRTLLKNFKQKESRQLAMHFHDTRGTALANVLASLDFDVQTFDSSIGGLGGCPYAKGASGNLPTEDLVYMLEGMGLKTGVNLEALIEVSKWIEKKVAHPLPGHLSKSGPFSKTGTYNA